MKLTLRTSNEITLLGPSQVAGLTVALIALHLTSLTSYVLFHSLVEVARIIVMGGIFVLAWHSRRWGSNRFLLVVGIASLFIGGVEVLHTLAYKGLGVFSDNDANLPTQLWIVFRYLESATFVVAALLMTRPAAPMAVLMAYSVITLALLASVFYGVFPDCFIEGHGLTRFKIGSEYVIIALFLGCLGILFRRRREFDPGVLVLIMGSILAGVVSELAFTRYVSVFGFANEVGHHCLLISAYLLYRAVLVTGLIAPYDLLFLDLRRSEAELEHRVEQRTAELQESETQAIAFAENSPAIIYLTDFRGHFTRVNRSFERLIGRPREEIIGKTVFDLFSPETAEILDRHGRVSRDERRPSIIEEMIKVGDSTRILETVRFPILDPTGTTVGTGGIATDVSDIRLAQARYGAILKTSMDGFVIVDVAGHFVEVNDAMCEISGYSRLMLMKIGLAGVEASQDAEAIETNLRKIAAAGFARFDSRWRRPDGTLVDVEVSVKTLDELSGTQFFAFVRDITERKAAIAEIEFLAHHDQLTGLPNKLLFEDRFIRATAQVSRLGQKLALLYLDMDNFKVINDTLGHNIGDALIKCMSERLCDVVREVDSIGRIGGDEFLILLSDVQNDSDVALVAMKIREQLSQPIKIDQHELVTTVSIGIALYPADGKDFDTLLKQVDTAMFQAKADGRNAYRFFNEAMNADAISRLEMLSRLRGGLERKEFLLHYQPQVELAGGTVIGAEALIRWQSPEFGLVPPGKFIPVAEDSGLIVSIGAWVLQEACRQAVLWRNSGYPDFVIAVNLSAVQFRDQDLHAVVTAALLESGLDASGLELELTESILIRDTESVLESVKRLKTLGIKLSIDDFGTGYSSLAYLKRFQVDKLKIDQSFIRDMDTDPDDSALVHAIIQMARSLGLRTIAEGVEHGHLIDHLRVHHCDEVQGYFYARPMPAHEFDVFLKNHRAPT